MITKEKFIEYCNILKELSDEENYRNKLWKKLFPDSYIFENDHKKFSLIMELLSELVPESKWATDGNEETDYPYANDIEWWYYEYVNNPLDRDNPKPLVTHINGKEYLIDTPESLWNCIHHTDIDINKLKA